MRVPYVFLKYSRPNNINSGESKWHAHGRDTLWRNFASGKYENRVTAPWEIMRQYGTEVYFRLSLSLSSPIGYVRCKPCSWLNLCKAYGRQNKIRYCCLHSISHFIVLKNDHLSNYIKKKIAKKNRKNERYPRCSESFTFRCSTLNALSRNYDICISHGKNLSKRRLIRKVQPTNFESKPKTERKDQLYI